MQIDILGHATTLIEIEGVRLLQDPHLFGEFRDGLFSYFPSRIVTLEDLPLPDGIILSHVHRDHFDLRSLDALPRGALVFCPPDPRILFGLDALGFHDVVAVQDWSTFPLTDGCDLLWTPSTYRVPENGLAIRSKEACVWNLVDSHVTSEWAERARDWFGRSVDLLLAPTQPLLETEICESVLPRPRFAAPSGVLTPEGLIDLLRPKVAAPFADGHYCSGPAQWLNHQKFPLDHGSAAERLARGGTRVVTLEPGDRLQLENGDVEVRRGAVGYVQRGPVQDRRFHPGGWIAPIRGTSAVGTAFGEAVQGALERRAELASRLRAAFGSALDPAPVRYRLMTIGVNGEPAEVFTFSLGEETGTGESGLIEIAVAQHDADDVATGRLGFSALLLGGLVREWRHLTPEVQVVTSEHDRLDPGARHVLSGAMVVNLLLSFVADGGRLELQEELSALKNGVQRRRPLVDGSPPEGVALSAPEALAPLWARLEDVLQRGLDPSDASGVYAWEGQDTFCVIPGRGTWHSGPSTPHMPVLLIPLFILEAQPHLGLGVRPPLNSLQATIRQIADLPNPRLTILRAIPPAIEVPRWRVVSLFPFSDDLLADLLEGRRSGWSEEGREAWWLGTPRLPNSRVTRVLEIRVDGSDLRGVAADGWIDQDDASCPTPGFRLECRTPHQRMLDVLVSGDCRFSLLPGTVGASSCLEAGEEHVERIAASALKSFLASVAGTSTDDR